MSSSLPEMLVDEAEQAFTNRAPHEETWSLIRRFMMPDGNSFYGAHAPGERSRQEVYDNHGEHAAEMMAAGLHAMMTNPATKFFAMTAVDPERVTDYLGLLWLEMVTDLMLGVVQSHKTRFFVAIGANWQDAVTFGNAPLYTEARPGRLPIFRAWPIQSVAWAEGEEDTAEIFYRKLELTNHQVATLFPETAPKEIVEAAGKKGSMFDRVKLLHVVKPRPGGDPNTRVARRMPVAAYMVTVDKPEILRESGHPENPVVATRWNKRSNEVYARGPGDKALADVLTLQRSMRATIRGGETAIEPPLMLADDGVAGPISLRNGALTYVDRELMEGPGDPIRPIVTGARPDLGEEFNEAIRRRIDRAFGKELLQLAREPQMTATHVLELREEQLRGMSPIVSRLEAETLGPLMDRLFGIMYRAGAFPPPPDSLRGVELRATFVSPAARAARIEEARALSQAVDIMTPVANLDPSILENQDWDKTYREVSRILGVPLSWLRVPEQVEAMRQARQQVDQAREDREEVKDFAVAANKAVPAIQAMQQQAGGLQAAA